MVISGLTSGNSYTLIFYFMAAINSQPALGRYGRKDTSHYLYPNATYFVEITSHMYKI